MEQGTVERSGVGVEQSFRIKASAKAFEILSSGLYSDKIKAILRELSCNAYDAHIAASNPDPFLIHLPNTLEPWFAIRDYGTGLSHEDVTTVFTTYFESTKTSSNDFIGCLGLGSKSPFSYTESFMVTSIHNGVKRIYNAFLNESKVPSIVLMSEEGSEDKNGLEIQFPVRSEDFNEFVRKTPSVFEYFKIKPTIVGASVEHKTVDYFIRRGNWSVRGKAKGSRDYSRARAVMGNVAYPLADYTQDDLTPAERAILDYDIDIVFDIGLLEVAASREKLSYDGPTKINIKNCLTKISTEIIEEIQNKIDTCNCLWDARKMVYSLRKGDYSIFASLIDASNTVLMWNGQALFDALNNHGTEFVRLTPVENYLTVKRFTNQVYRRRRGYNSSELEDLNSIPVSDKVYFFVQDVGKNILTRCEKFINTKLGGNLDGAHILILKLVDNAIDVTTGALVNPIKELKDLLGMDDSTPFPMLSTLPYDPVVSTGSGSYNPKNATKILVYNPNASPTRMGGRRSRVYSYEAMWEKKDIDLDAGGVYVAINRYMVNGYDPKGYVGMRLDLLQKIGVDDTVIYGVKESNLEKIRVRPNWISLNTYLKEKISEYLKTNNLMEVCGYHQELNNFKSELNYSNRDTLGVYGKWINDYGVQLFPNIPEINSHIQKLETIERNAAVFEDVIKLMKNVDMSAEIVYDAKTISESVRSDFAKAVRIIKRNYPMLRHMNMYEVETNPAVMKVVKAYVEAMDFNKSVAVVADDVKNDDGSEIDVD
jgi:hypothetical protein